MPTQRLPKLPGCGRPAVTRIEIYSPRETLHGSLDGSIYTCREHTDPARDAINAAGLTPHTMPIGGPKRCGDGHDFLAGRGMHAPDPATPTITPEQALTQLLDQKRAQDALLGKIVFQVTHPEISTSGAVAMIRDLLIEAGAIKAPFTFDDTVLPGHTLAAPLDRPLHCGTEEIPVAKPTVWPVEPAPIVDPALLPEGGA